MGDITRNMTGTSWHVERYERGEGDERRHRSHCMYFVREYCQCKKRNGKCIGSAHCLEYEKVTERVEEKEVKKEKYITAVYSNQSKDFEIRSIKLCDIVVDRHAALPQIAKRKTELTKDFIRNNKQFKGPVLVEKRMNRSGYKILDGYIRYLVAKENGLKEMPAFIGNVTMYKHYLDFRINGTLVKHKKYGTGTVIGSDIKTVLIKFDNGREMKFDTCMCMKNKMLEIIQ